jgi:hypothetical protein
MVTKLPVRFISVPSSESEPSDEALCENCARPDDDLATVQRIYLVPADPSTGAGAISGATEVVREVLDDLERWCFSCRTQYPHVVVEETD